jgi:hypothetical protein
MALFCQEEVNLNCDSCYELTKEYCDPIVIDPGVAPGYDTFYLQIIDKFIVLRTQAIELDVDGTFTIDKTLLPDDFLNPYAGKFELYLSVDEEGTLIIPMTFNENVYNCIILTIVKTIENDCC